MPFLVERVYRTITRHSLLRPGERVVVALSGGADSTALAHLLVELSPRGRFTVAGAVHYNHQLRGAASDDDERFSRAVADRLGLAWLADRGDVRAAARQAGASLEDAARRARYEFLEGAARRLGAASVAVGHTRDDQAETILLQMLRGAGPRGLEGMLPSRPLQGSSRDDDQPIRLVRPLLDVEHEELLGWLDERGLPHREDETNRDARFLRNRVRHELIPYLRTRFSPAVSRVLAREGAILAADARYLDDTARAAFARLATVGRETVELDVAGLLREPLAIGRRVALRALGNQAAPRFVGLDQVDRLLDLARGCARGPLALPGAEARLEGGKLVVGRAQGDRCRGHRTAGMNNPAAVLSIPGEARVGPTGWIVSSSVRQWGRSLDVRQGVEGGRPGFVAILDASRVSRLSVRTRRPGDSFRPLGLGGTKKLQDFLVDRKVPRAERDRLPLVVDGEDRIVWVAGHAIDESYRVSADTVAVVILTLRGESA